MFPMGGSNRYRLGEYGWSREAGLWQRKMRTLMISTRLARPTARAPYATMVVVDWTEVSVMDWICVSALWRDCVNSPSNVRNVLSRSLRVDSLSVKGGGILRLW